MIHLHGLVVFHAFLFYFVFGFVFFGDRDDIVTCDSLFQGQPAEGELNDAPPPNRYSAVIEKIERLYMVLNIHLVFLVFE